ncbi:MAG: carboxymuconolactone decarboxylase family protein [Bryobacteraceae bacterium]
MRFAVLLPACLLAFSVVGFAQNKPDTSKIDLSKINLRGDRFAPLKYETMTLEQQAMIQHLLAGDRGTTTGPFNVMLRNPQWGDFAQAFGGQLRFHSSLPPRLSEMAILLVARLWTAQYEWYAHKPNALKGGLSPAIIESIKEGKRPANMKPDEEAVYVYTMELLTTHQVSDATFAMAKDRLTEKGVVDLMGLTGYYQLVSMLLNADRYPLPDGAQPELKPLPAR